MSPATTAKSCPAMARIVPPFSEYGLKSRVIGMTDGAMVDGMEMAEDGSGWGEKG